MTDHIVVYPSLSPYFSGWGRNSEFYCNIFETMVQATTNKEWALAKKKKKKMCEGIAEGLEVEELG
jgi:hypothetical protein